MVKQTDLFSIDKIVSQESAEQMELNLLKGEVFTAVKQEKFPCYDCGKYVMTVEDCQCEECYNSWSEDCEQVKLRSM